MYMALRTRPDIANVAGILSQYNSCCSLEQWNAAKRVLRYLKWTINFAVVISKSNTFLEGYVDAINIDL